MKLTISDRLEVWSAQKSHRFFAWLRVKLGVPYRR